MALRGGIATGSTYHKGNVVFGQGLINAFDLERYVAVYPRIVVDEMLVQRMQKRHADFVASAPPRSRAQLHISEYAMLRRDVDGCHFVDFLRPSMGSVCGNTPEDLRHSVEVYYRTMKKAIENRMGCLPAKSPQQLSHCAKNRWLARYFNEVLPADYAHSVGPIRWSLDGTR
jgi:hypothetical protein